MVRLYSGGVIMLKVSPFFFRLYSQYLSELQHLSRDCGGEENSTALSRSLHERRQNPSVYLDMKEEFPESAAVIFYDMFDFTVGTPDHILENLVNTDSEELVLFSDITKEVGSNITVHPLIHTVQKMEGGNTFLVIAIGLEYLRCIDWVPTEADILLEEPDYQNDENEWLHNEAPQVLGLDLLTTINE